MEVETADHPGSVNLCLAEYLDGQKQVILNEWLQRVSSDATILPTRFLDDIAITNRLPALFDDLSATLRRYGSTRVAEQALRDAREHGATRSTQGYALCEVLREIKHFRSILLYHLRTFEDLHPDYGLAAMLFVSTIVHRFLDEVMIDTAREFRAAEHDEKNRK
jgi:hypothetical protein